MPIYPMHAIESKPRRTPNSFAAKFFCLESIRLQAIFLLIPQSTYHTGALQEGSSVDMIHVVSPDYYSLQFVTPGSL